MPIFTTGPVYKPDVHYLFIDGGCLRAELSRFSDRYLGGARPAFNYSRFANGHSKIFYYDGLPLPADASNPTAEENAKLEEMIVEHNELRSLSDWHVYAGEVRGKKRRQKKVDILIAVHMLSHAFRGNMERATLLAGDLDFEPLLEAMVQNGMTVTLWHPTKKVVPELLHAADRVKPLMPSQIAEALEDSQKAVLKFPSVHLENINPLGAASSIRSWQESGRGQANLYNLGGAYTAVFPYSGRDQRSLVVNSPDLNLLRNYVDDSWGVTVPE